MNKSFKYIILLFIFLALTGCADGVTLEQAIKMEEVGFLHGFWHGLIFPIAFICSLFSNDVAVYAIYNNGGWYDFGFFLGIGGIGVGLFRI